MSLFLDTDAETLTRELISDFESFTGQTLKAGDQRRQFLQGFAYVMAMLVSDIEETGKQNLVGYSTGDALDALGELVGVTRLEASGASCTLQFTLSAVQADAVYIPAGTRATADGDLFFATDEALVIAAGDQSGTVTATCTTTGSGGNGFVAGQLATLVDGISYVQSVTNTTETSGGADVETDDELRERIREAPAAFSTCGPTDAYAYWAKEASADVEDVAVDSPSDGVVRIVVIKTGGVIPAADDEVLTAISDMCSAKDKRPLTDQVTVIPATAVNTSINLTYYVAAEDVGKLTEIQSAVTNAIEEYKTWQTSAIGKNINPDKLRLLILSAGASRVDLTSPVYTEVDMPGVAQFGEDTVAFGGLEE